MASLIDIGKSGLQSYRQALAVTGQNISNINTDGYKRRAADLEEVTANKGGISSTNNQTGLGVRVAGIRRSFDEFPLNKAPSATSYSETNEKYLSTITKTVASASIEEINLLEESLWKESLTQGPA